MSVLVALALGLGLGVITGMPLGVVNVAIVDAAVAGRRRFATGVGLGGALADTAHAALAFVGVGRLVTSHPELVRGLAIAAAVLILGYAALAWRRRGHPEAPTSNDTSTARGLATGVVLTLPNPGALAAWVAVAAALWPDATTAESLALAAGVGVGSAAWFVALARLVARVPRDHRALRIVPRAALLIFAGVAIAGVVRVTI